MFENQSKIQPNDKTVLGEMKLSMLLQEEKEELRDQLKLANEEIENLNYQIKLLKRKISDRD